MYKKVVLALVLLIILLLVFGCAEKRELQVDELDSLHNKYQTSRDNFFREYDIVEGTEIVNYASISRALNALNNSKLGLEGMKGNLTEIMSINAALKGKYSEGDKANWLTLVGGCYQKRLNVVELYTTVVENEEVFLKYYNETLTFDSNFERFETELTAYLNGIESSSTQEQLDSLNKIKAVTSKMNKNAKDANDILNFNYMETFVSWTEKYEECIDLSIKATNDYTIDNYNMMITKCEEAGELLQNARSSAAAEEIDAWSTENIGNKEDDAKRVDASSDADCTAASEIFAAAWPSNT